ncbi:hypothetical protein MWN34_01115 [Ancylobacter sp. 6x-1]|uniref:Uncharacterized protein n=1 Tax=Ancylobacter crimeensis TaxID=2579147 RepID=A0ABT0D6D2_9HYPH|nr:hypothetical protein [Ancylobacter crimeensis]MCK0195506.1 hypothetical protein [Ancylobacter crimeensis]
MERAEDSGARRVLFDRIVALSCGDEDMRSLFAHCSTEALREVIQGLEQGEAAIRRNGGRLEAIWSDEG